MPNPRIRLNYQQYAKQCIDLCARSIEAYQQNRTTNDFHAIAEHGDYCRQIHRNSIERHSRLLVQH